MKLSLWWALFAELSQEPSLKCLSGQWPVIPPMPMYHVKWVVETGILLVNSYQLGSWHSMLNTVFLWQTELTRPVLCIAMFLNVMKTVLFRTNCLQTLSAMETLCKWIPNAFSNTRGMWLTFPKDVSDKELTLCVHHMHLCRSTFSGNATHTCLVMPTAKLRRWIFPIRS